jgi:acyl carrier protein
MTETERSIVQFIAELASGETVAIDSDTRLIELGIVDSMGLVRLIQFVEQQFGVVIPDADVTPDLFETPAALAAYVAGHR